MPNLSLYQDGFGKNKPNASARLDTSHSNKPVLCYLLNEKSGSIHDIAGNNSATLGTGVSWNSKGLSFAGTGSVNSARSYQINRFTIVAEVVVTAIPPATSFGGIVCWADSAQLRSELFINSSGNLGITYKTAGSGFAGSSFRVTSTYVTPLNTTLHIVCTSDGVNQAMYVNGQPVTLSGVVTGAGVGTANVFRMGDLAFSTTGFYLSGQINYAYIYDYALPAAAAFNLYQKPFHFISQPGPKRAFLAPSTQHIYNETGSSGVLLNGTGTVTADYSVSGSNGVLLNGTGTVNADYIVSGSSGVLLNGSGSPGIIYSNTGSNGVLLNGSAGINADYNTTGSSGVLLNGSAVNNEFTYQSGSSGVLINGSATPSGATNNTYNETGSGGVILNGPSYVSLASFLTGSSGVLVGGSADIHGFIYNADVSTPLQLSGNGSPLKATYIYLPTGNNDNAPPNNSGISIGYQNDLNPTIVNYTTNNVYDFRWEVDGYDQLTFDFSWNVGSSRRYWYRVVGTSKTDGCPPLNMGDGCCRQYVTNVLARSTEDLCTQLRNQGWQWPIDSVQRFSKPAETSAVTADAAAGIIYDCNEAIPVDICSNAACQEFCLGGNDVVESWGIYVFAQSNAFPIMEASGGLSLSGKAITNFSINSYQATYQATGGIALTGSADVVSSNYQAIANGGLTLGGTPDLVSSNWTFMGGIWPTPTAQLAGQTVSQFSEVSGDLAWINLPSVLTTDGQYAICDFSSNNNSQFLVVSGFNVNIPANVNVLGIKATITRHATGSVRDNEIYLMMNNQIISDNMSTGVNWSIGVDYASIIGGELVLWKTGSWDINTLNSANLGIALRVTPLAIGAKAYIDSIVLEIYYEELTYQRLRIGGTGNIQSSAYQYIASGGLSLSNPEQLVVVNRVVKELGVGRIGPRFTSLTLGGQYFPNFTYEATGGLTIGGQANTACTNWNYTASGGLNLSGEAPTQSSNYHWFANASGDPQLSGSAFAVPQYIFVSEGSLSLSGSYSTQGSHLEQDGSGGLTIGGIASVISTNYQWQASGGITLTGSATQKESDLGLKVEYLGMSAFCQDIAFVFGIDSTTSFTEPAVSISECSCSALPGTMPFNQNLAQNNKFSQFLTRNNSTFPNILSLKYNQLNNSWQVNAVYNGYSANTPNKESWSFVADLQCTTSLSGTEIGQSVWKLGLRIIQKDLVSLQEFETRILVGFLPTGCNSASDFKFTIDFNTQTGLANITPNATIYQNKIYDNIGLFKELFWINNPNLTLAISNSGFSAPVPQIALAIS